MADSVHNTETNSARKSCVALITTMRPKQWPKNLLVFLPLLFTINETWEISNGPEAAVFFGRSVAAFGTFSILSSAIYILNDVMDSSRDQAHPRKKFRPIASGKLPLRLAITTAIVLGFVSVCAAFVIESLFGVIAVGYLLMMIVYSLALKSVVLLDVFVIGGGFVLRIIAGATVIQVPISPWLYLCTGFGALFIALSKRRSELAASGDSANLQRGVLGEYSLGILDQMISIVAVSALISYSLYTFTASNLPDNHAMMLTIPCVAYGIFRYLFLLHTSERGEEPENIIISDIPMITSIVLWLGLGATILIVFRT